MSGHSLTAAGVSSHRRCKGRISNYPHACPPPHQSRPEREAVGSMGVRRPFISLAMHGNSYAMQRDTQRDARGADCLAMTNLLSPTARVVICHHASA